MSHSRMRASEAGESKVSTFFHLKPKVSLVCAWACEKSFLLRGIPSLITKAWPPNSKDCPSARDATPSTCCIQCGMVCKSAGDLFEAMDDMCMNEEDYAHVGDLFEAMDDMCVIFFIHAVV